eukprot:767796-Hanusia_phi.AAC.1
MALWLCSTAEDEDEDEDEDEVKKMKFGRFEQGYDTIVSSFTSILCCKETELGHMRQEKRAHQRAPAFRTANTTEVRDQDEHKLIGGIVQRDRNHFPDKKVEYDYDNTLRDFKIKRPLFDEMKSLDAKINTLTDEYHHISAMQLMFGKSREYQARQIRKRELKAQVTFASGFDDVLSCVLSADFGNSGEEKRSTAGVECMELSENIDQVQKS